jgi:glycosyltransferase involved in cell wall biosynthesis
MFIAIDASRANRPQKSGTEWYSYYLIKNLARLDGKNQYLLYSDKPLTGGLLDLGNMDLAAEDVCPPPIFDREGFQIIKSPHGNFRGRVLSWPFSFFWTLGRLSMRMLVEKPDILFVPAHSLPLVRAKKTINTIHDVAFRDNQAGHFYDNRALGPNRSRFFKKIMNFLIRIMTRGRFGSGSLDYLHWSTEYSLKHSDLILAVSEHTKKEIISNYPWCDSNKIKVVHNGYNEKIYREQDDKKKQEEILSKYGLPNAYILYIGRLERKKNTPFLIEAFAKLKQRKPDLKEKLVLVGSASFGYNEVKCLIDQYGLSSEVLLTGWIKEEDMPYVVAGANAYVLPSLHEGFGITILQALASGVPTAVSDIPVLREVAGEAAVFFNPNDKEEISLAMEKIILDGVLRHRLITSGLERVKKFSWEKCAAETLTILNYLK